MTQLHLIKLCVGSSSPEELADWQNSRPHSPRHVTRSWPRRAGEIAGKGSLYWVMAGEIRARQLVLGFEEVRGEDGIRRCAILFDPAIILTAPRPRRAFQGWRYLEAKDAPPDIGVLGKDGNLPPELEGELSRLGVG